jgi:hydroxyacylglutathione hydrolase
MKVERYAVGPLETNCYHVICEKTGESVLVDPGGFPEELFRENRKPLLKAILLTHGHFDHIGGAGEAARLTGAPIMIHTLDAPLLEDPYLNGSAVFGMGVERVKPDILLSGGEYIEFGECGLTVLQTPGHTRGGISFHSPKEQIIFAGDELFRLSVGRWDLPGGNYRTLVETIRTLFAPLPDVTVVYPGHGDSTTIGFERKYNEFMRE